MTDATHPSAEPTPPQGDAPREAAVPAPEIASAPPREPMWQKVLAAIERPGTAGFLATIGVLLALVLGGAISSITLILIYIVLGLFLALALDPIVRMLERRGRKRGTGIAFVFAGFLVIVGFFTIFLLPPVVNQIGQFIATAPEAILACPGGRVVRAAGSRCAGRRLGGAGRAVRHPLEPRVHRGDRRRARSRSASVSSRSSPAPSSSSP